MRVRLACWITVTALAATASAAARAVPGDLEGLITLLGFDSADMEDLLDGEVILLDEDLAEGSDAEMAVGAAVLLPVTLERAAAILRSDRDLRRLGDPPVAADFAAVRYSDAEWEEVESLLEAEPGSTFNLSTAEIARFARLGRVVTGRSPKKDALVREATAEQLRVVLLDRCLAYHAGGLAAIAAYDRGDGEQVSPGAELELALTEDLAQDARLGPLVGPIQQALRRYPQPAPDGVQGDLYWSKTDVADRPCFVLTHRMSSAGAGAVLVVERQFYVGHDYEALQVVMIAIPTRRGVLLAYRNRTFTDQVAGHIGAAKKIIARRRQRGAVVEYLEELRRTPSRSPR